MLDPQQQATLVTAGGFAVGAAFGALAQYSRFCTLGAIADIVAMGDWTRMRMWTLAIAVAILGSAALAGGGLLSPTQTIYGSPRLLWLSHLAGGLAFGVGMVLASGCGAKSLVRLGGGSLKALVACLCIALAGAATLHGLPGIWRSRLLDSAALQLPTSQDLPSLLALASDLPRLPWHLGLATAGGLGLLAWSLAGRDARRREALAGGLGTGLAVLVGWWLTAQLGHLAEHPETLQEAWLATNSGRAESLSFVAPQAYGLELLMLWSDSGRTLTFGIATALGTIAGAAACALWRGEFRWEGFRDTGDLARHLVGGCLMGMGGVTALGCTIGQGITGLGTLAIGSLLTFAAILTGAVLTMRWEYRRLAGD